MLWIPARLALILLAVGWHCILRIWWRRLILLGWWGLILDWRLILILLWIDGRRLVLLRRVALVLCRGRLLTVPSRRSGCLLVWSRRSYRATSTQVLLLIIPHLLLLGLHSRCSCLDQGVFNWTSDIRWEDRACIHRTRYRLFPSLQHLVHLSPDAIVHQCISFHEGRVKLATEKEGIGGTDIFDDGIEDVECRQLLLRGGLRRCK